MARPKLDTVQITFRIPREWLTKLDALARKMKSERGLATRTDALRTILAAKLEKAA